MEVINYSVFSYLYLDDCNDEMFLLTKCNELFRKFRMGELKAIFVVLLASGVFWPPKHQDSIDQKMTPVKHRNYSMNTQKQCFELYHMPLKHFLEHFLLICLSYKVTRLPSV